MAIVEDIVQLGGEPTNRWLVKDKNLNKHRRKHEVDVELGGEDSGTLLLQRCLNEHVRVEFVLFVVFGVPR